MRYSGMTAPSPPTDPVVRVHLSHERQQADPTRYLGNVGPGQLGDASGCRPDVATLRIGSWCLPRPGSRGTATSISPTRPLGPDLSTSCSSIHGSITSRRSGTSLISHGSFAA